MTLTEIQRALQTLGYALNVTGVLDDETEAVVEGFQLATGGLVVDGDPGPKTQAALTKALAAKAKKSVPPPPVLEPAAITVPLAWMPACTMTGIVVHWSAGGHKASALDRSHYHVMIEGDGRLVRGDRAIKANAKPLSRLYAAHTLGHNTGIIGISLCCMAGAVESPFKTGSAPLTPTQWDVLPHALADLCRRYGIKVTPRTVLSHAEVQGTLGIQQRGKWDISRLSFDLSIKGAGVIGDLFRQRTAALLAA